MKKIYYLMAMAMMAFTFTSCEDVPEPFGQPINPNGPAETIEPAGTGTEADPFNIAAAIAKCQEVGETASSEKYYIKGITHEEYTVSSFKNIEIDIFDTEDSKAAFKVYRCKGPEGKDIDEGLVIKKGSEIVIYGPVVNYKGNTPETSSGAYVVSIAGVALGGGNSGGGSGTGGGGNTGGANMLTNGDFETWTGDLPDNWKTTSSAGNATLTKSTDARNGSFSVSVGFNATKNMRMGYKELNLKAGTYTFSFYAKATTADKSQTQAGFVPVTDGTAGKYTYGGYVSLKNTEWTLVSTTFTLEAATTVSLVMMNPKTSEYAVAQNILVDDATLTTTDGGIDDSGSTGGNTGGGSGSNHGTAEAPITVAQAIALIDAETTVAEAYVKGKISQIDSYNSQYKSITYWISDDGTTATQLQVYSGKGLDGADFSAKEDLTVGKNVVIKGKLKKYNTTYEFDKTSSIISID